ncbi:nucleotide exchange factor GrpE [Vulgatibacter incomptus]|uniref:Protein GrpE n=1 Tax=Vulgatibacter incomptus TaxID=1391653 RepID=A0A0K1PDM4_9BACT|nr:nucleotide exchange factor GrpE [Vulgatibacter incomptus]AKU91607.1 Heat shock protein GrpE [Vulgatibacter incomptus]
MENPEETQKPTETSEERVAEASSDELDSLRGQLDAKSKRIDELSRAYADALNDRESFKRRMEREKDRQVERAQADSATLLLDAMDDLRRALASSTKDAAALAEGVRLIADALQRRLEGVGVVPVHAEGQVFDPLVHEAVDMVPTNDRESDGVVIEEIRGGWKIGEKVIRPVRVRVARYVPGPEGAA